MSTNHETNGTLGALTPAAAEPAAPEPAAPKPAAPIVLRGRKVVGGCVEGEALVTRDRISGWGGIDPRTGTIIETRHELRGQSFANKVLVFPGAKGSSGWSSQFHIARIAGTAPAAMLFNEMTTKIALGAVVSHAPSLTEFDIDPLDVIETGDWVRVDAERGVVEVLKRSRA
ncbi:putative aconitase with swiveling domain [Paraburkholderia atlantica]|uniref:aconitase X swivel domain-containing protein n=1 Tax=Paraburkholderia atlantica TaxID=2654982 RepID=UPI003D1D04B8